MPIVFAGATAHAIGIHGWPERVPVDERTRLYDACEELGARVRSAKPDVIIYATTDHFSNFSSDNMPQFCIGTAASYYGPKEDFKDVPKGWVPGDAEFSVELLEMFLQNGFDPSSAAEVGMSGL